MENRLIEVLTCPECRGEFESDDAIIICSSCGKTFPCVNGTIDLLPDSNLELSAKETRDDILYKIKKRIFHPTTNFPFSYITKIKRERLYEKCLNDKSFAERFRQTYIPVEYRAKTGLVLDLGCGRGRHCAVLSQCGFDVIGINPEYNNYWNNISKAQFIKGTDKELAFFKNSSFDICLSMLMLMYVDDDNSLIRDLSRILKKGGFLILQVTNKYNLRTLVTKRWLTDEPFKRYYSIGEIRSVLELNGFIIKSIWTEKIYFPFFHHVFGFILEILLPDKISGVLSKIIPARFRGLINVIAQKC